MVLRETTPGVGHERGREGVCAEEEGELIVTIKVASADPWHVRSWESPLNWCPCSLMAKKWSTETPMVCSCHEAGWQLNQRPRVSQAQTTKMVYGGKINEKKE